MPISGAFSPKTLTILCTYQCTAACKQCCFESSPSVKGRLSKSTIIDRISEAKRAFLDLSVVVFSGGEAFMLKDDLMAAIAHSTSQGLATRVVSNGYWGKTESAARKVAAQLRAAGLCELNISTGKDHQEWVPTSSVINAAVATIEAGIYCLITVENEGSDRSIVDRILRDPKISPHFDSGAISIQSNSWMSFHGDAEQRHQEIAPEELRKGCDQIFGTVVVTPHDNLSACCGLTLEHIPEMRLGKNDGTCMDRLYAAQRNDFMKSWIHVEGPYSIIEKVMGEESKSLLKDVVHICEACSIMHKNPKVRDAIRAKYREFVPEIQTRLQIMMALRDRSDHLSKSCNEGEISYGS